MSGISLTIDVEGDAHAKLRSMIERLEDKQPFFTAASLMMRDQTMDRFTGQHGPDGVAWAPLAPLTVAMRGGRATPILEDTGSFRAQISPQPEPGRAVVVTGPFVQAAILQFGGTITPKAGKALVFGPEGGKVFAKSVTIPARPYFGFSDDNVADLLDLAEASFFG